MLAGAALGCGSSSGSSPLDPFNTLSVRYAGGETSDFGNGTDDECGTRTDEHPITAEEARGFADIDADAAWLAEPHRAALRWTTPECAGALESCELTEVELVAKIDGYVRVDGHSSRDLPGCAPEWRSLAYRGRVGLRTADGRLSGAFNARLRRGTDDAGNPDVYAMVRPDLRNFDGTLPLHIDTDRPHHAYVTIGLDLAADGRASGYLRHSLHYYDEEGGSPDIGASAAWDSEATPPADPLTAIDTTGRFVTPTTYGGSPREPRVILTARADAVEPATDVDVVVRVDGDVIRRGRVEPGTYFELGEHPFGVGVSLDVENSGGAGMVRAHILQDNCFVETARCTEPSCVARAEYTTSFQLCYD